MRSSSLLFLEPPYAAVRRLTGEQPTLGTIALLDVTRERPGTSEIRTQMELAPWCPLCLLAAPQSGMRSVRRIGRTCVVFGLDRDDASAAILYAVAQRPRPTASDFAEWITRRARMPTLTRVLVNVFSRPALRRSEAALLPYTVREQFSQLGEFDARDWQRLIELAEVAADRSQLNRKLRGTDDGAAELREDIHELLGVTEVEYRDRYGWEWVLERGLRQSGFFDLASARHARVMRPREVEVTRTVAASGIWSDGPVPAELPAGAAAKVDRDTPTLRQVV